MQLGESWNREEMELKSVLGINRHEPLGNEARPLLTKVTGPSAAGDGRFSILSAYHRIFHNEHVFIIRKSK